MYFSTKALLVSLSALFTVMVASAPFASNETAALEARFVGPRTFSLDDSEIEQRDLADDFEGGNHLEKRGYSGRATWYLTAGAKGACGKQNKESDKIVALNSKQYKGSLCGKMVTIKNKKNGKTVRAKVADRCPGCGYGSLDLTKGAFKALGSLDTGVLSISWSFS